MTEFKTTNLLRPAIVFPIIFSIVVQAQVAQAQRWGDDPRHAEYVAKKKGKTIATEVLDWHTSPKDIPKEWKEIENTYFSASYPKCFTLKGEGGDDDLKTSPAVLFSRSTSCDMYKKEIGDGNAFEIVYDNGNPLRTASAASASDSLFVQNLKINGIDAKMIVNVMDATGATPEDHILQLRWQIFLLCGKKTMRIDIDYGKGKPTSDLIEKADYKFPEDFKQIVSTFKCK
jgi:hypothetical protein